MSSKIITRQDAKISGLKRYFTGKPCKYGHITERCARNYECCECSNNRWLPYYLLNKDKLKKKRKVYIDKNKDAISSKSRDYKVKNKIELSVKAKIYRTENTGKVKETNRKSKIKNKEKAKITNKIYRANNKGMMSAKAKTASNSPANYSTYARQLVGHSCRNNNGNLEVECKKCSAWFMPRCSEVKSRVLAIKGKTKTPGTELNMYCSEKCKQSCDIYNRKTKPKYLADKTAGSRCRQSLNRKILFDLQTDRYGYNFCEKCGTKTDKLEIHHSIMISDNYQEADNMAHQLLLCIECHTKPEAHCRG